MKITKDATTELDRAAKAVGGLSIEEFNAREAAQEHQRREIDKLLETPGMRRCLITLKITTTVDVDCPPAGDHAGKYHLFQAAIAAFEDEAGMTVDTRCQEFECDVQCTSSIYGKHVSLRRMIGSNEARDVELGESAMRKHGVPFYVRCDYQLDPDCLLNH